MPNYDMQGGSGMQGGLFGPMSGPQNFGGRGQLTDQEMQMLLGQMQSQSPTGGSLPMYNSPSLSPQEVPGLGSTGIDPNMLAGGASGGLQGMDFGPQAGDQMGGMQDAIMSMGRQKAEEERIAKLLAASMSGMSGGGSMQAPTGFTPNNYASGLGNDARPTGGAFSGG
jgi:hypothetical protein